MFYDLQQSPGYLAVYFLIATFGIKVCDVIIVLQSIIIVSKHTFSIVTLTIFLGYWRMERFCRSMDTVG